LVSLGTAFGCPGSVAFGFLLSAPFGGFRMIGMEKPEQANTGDASATDETNAMAAASLIMNKNKLLVRRVQRESTTNKAVM
jgi:hypothetical protein